ncbi:hypothetical protein LZL65_30250, partial [Pseudomonas aeruginosa]|nr:hypothetical protein [Pseudomonas aeruginosa]
PYQSLEKGHAFLEKSGLYFGRALLGGVPLSLSKPRKRARLFGKIWLIFRACTFGGCTPILIKASKKGTPFWKNLAYISGVHFWGVYPYPYQSLKKGHAFLEKSGLYFGRALLGGTPPPTGRHPTYMPAKNLTRKQ